MSEIMNGSMEKNASGVKRKKKRSANQMAKKLARSRNSMMTSDRGSQLDDDSYKYMVNILQVLSTDFSTMDDKLIFVNNVFEQMTGNEAQYATNQVASRVIDTLIHYASLEVIQRFTDALSTSLRKICSDKCGSHVLEKIILTCADRGNKIAGSTDISGNEVSVTEDQIGQYNNITLKLCKYIVNNIEEFIYDLYANHILRSAVKCLGGYVEKRENQSRDDQTKKKTTEIFNNKRIVIQEYTDLLVDTGNRLLKWPQFMEFGKDELTSGFLQTFLHSTKANDYKLNKSIIKKVMNECFTDNSDDNLSSAFASESSLRLLESCLAVAEPKMYKKLYEKYFNGALDKVTLMKGGNFTVQRLLDYCPTKELFEEIFDTISQQFTPILERQYTGVLSSLANACLRLQAKQGPFINVIAKSLNCDESSRQTHLVSLIASLVTYDRCMAAKDTKTVIPVNLHGSLILQATLQFNKPIKIVNSLLAMAGDELTKLLCDPKGSRILDAFMDSKYVGEKSRDKLFKQLKGHWVTLVHGVHGSRCIDKMWQYAKTNQKAQIMDELASQGQALSSTKTGLLISNKYNVPLYAKNKKDWSEYEGKQEKTKTLFAKIIS